MIFNHPQAIKISFPLYTKKSHVNEINICSHFVLPLI